MYVLAGPSGVGKGTVVAALKSAHPELFVSVSATTRAPRPGEVDGVHYRFIDDRAFDELIASGGLLEWAEVHGLHRYGTPAAPIRERLDAGEPVLVEIDLAGARQVRDACPDAHLVFLSPPSLEELLARLKGRGTESAEEQATRMRTAEAELAARDEFDTVIVNRTVDEAAAQLASLMGLD